MGKIRINKWLAFAIMGVLLSYIICNYTGYVYMQGRNDTIDSFKLYYHQATLKADTTTH